MRSKSACIARTYSKKRLVWMLSTESQLLSNYFFVVHWKKLLAEYRKEIAQCACVSPYKTEPTHRLVKQRDRQNVLDDLVDRHSHRLLVMPQGAQEIVSTDAVSISTISRDGDFSTGRVTLGVCKALNQRALLNPNSEAFNQTSASWRSGC